MKNFFKHNRAETILEVIIAVTVLMLILAPASALYISSTHTIAGNRNDLIAAALAEEGIEMLRNMRDTNLLKFSPKATECWNTKPDHDTLTDPDAPGITDQNCEDPDNKIETGFYQLDIDVASDDLKLEKQTSELHRELDPSGQPTGPYDLTGVDDENYRLKLDEIPATCPPGTPPAPDTCGPHEHFVNDTHLYNHSEGVDVNFYRQIEVEYLNLDAAADAEAVDEEGMRIISTILYRTGTQVRSIQRALILTNQPS